MLENHCQSVHTSTPIYIYMHPTSSLPSPHITQWTRHLHETPASISGTWSGWISLRLCQHRRLQPLAYTSRLLMLQSADRWAAISAPQQPRSPLCVTAGEASAAGEVGNLRAKWCCFNITGRFGVSAAAHLPDLPQKRQHFKGTQIIAFWCIPPASLGKCP